MNTANLFLTTFLAILPAASCSNSKSADPGASYNPMPELWGELLGELEELARIHAAPELWENKAGESERIADLEAFAEKISSLELSDREKEDLIRVWKSSDQVVHSG